VIGAASWELVEPKEGKFDFSLVDDQINQAQKRNMRLVLPIHEKRREGAGKYDGIGWHTFRHTYRSWLDDTGAPMGVQEKLMRHAQISTTMNVYGNALMTAKREANSKVVRMALRSA
jgi:integrase